uniref:Phosphatidylinositol transfer protein alpha isoform n=1 Tax=Kryptolebias marmoratus TaxID=37003 RepID=A0A3Q3B8J8_KRYMA
VVVAESFKMHLVISQEIEHNYKVGQLYAVAEASKNETGGGDGVEVIKNEPYEKDGEKGQYTHKIYHLQNKVPSLIRKLAPKGSLDIHEEAWNAYPYCRTSDPYLKEKFMIKIETWHKPDMGEHENVHNLEENKWKNTEVIQIDIADRSSISDQDYKPEQDPAKFKSEKTGRGPLEPGWQDTLAQNADTPHMCAYKLVSVDVRYIGLQSKLENYIHKVENRLFKQFHRQLFCSIDEWIHLTMEDIRRMEDETKENLQDRFPARGLSG